ncbi:hypothetical protein DM860_008826 [Cuscuta australis]|uniref:DUF1685 domain-containing protein n=1 Tax=Cuscuta australis TaxID=267555 RepID=A0A328D882_9ASTE|nr:hypothetical protein DM860_008826 [Cuscuta australis]
MEGVEEILKLFDSCWFEKEILIVNETNKPLINDLKSKEKMGSLKIRSQSDNLLAFRTNVSPESRYRKRIRGEGWKKKKVRAAAGAGEKLRGAKSLSEHELEELKGFMDLGFVFTDEDRKSGLASIVPGLQRWGSRGGDEEDDDDDGGRGEESNGNEAIIERPYLSEAWRSMDQRKMIKKLLKWRIPPGPRDDDDDDESAMKDNLRFWAQTVASALR